MTLRPLTVRKLSRLLKEKCPNSHDDSRLLWCVTKGSSGAQRRVRDAPHLRDLRAVVGGDGREERIVR